MYIIAKKTEMSFIIYATDKASDASTRCGALLDEQGASFTYGDVVSDMDVRAVTDLLTHLGMWSVDLVDREHETWTDSHLNEESDDTEIIEFIAQNPEVIRTPIVVKKEGEKTVRAILCDVPENVFSFFS